MNILTNNPTAALHVAHRTIDDRIQAAEARARARGVRAHRRADRRARRLAPLPTTSVRTPATASLAKPAH